MMSGHVRICMVAAQGVVTPICAVLRAATGVTICDRPKTASDRMTALLNCR